MLHKPAVPGSDLGVMVWMVPNSSTVQKESFDLFLTFFLVLSIFNWESTTVVAAALSLNPAKAIIIIFCNNIAKIDDLHFSYYVSTCLSAFSGIYGTTDIVQLSGSPDHGTPIFRDLKNSIYWSFTEDCLDSYFLLIEKLGL